MLFSKKEGRNRATQKKNLSETHMWCRLRDSRTRATLVGGGGEGDVNALTTSPKHFSEVLNYSYLCSNHKLRPSWKCDHAIPKGQCGGIGI